MWPCAFPQTESRMDFKNMGVHRVEKHPLPSQSASDLQMRVSSNHSLGGPRKAENMSVWRKVTKGKGCMISQGNSSKKNYQTRYMSFGPEGHTMTTSNIAFQDANIEGQENAQ